MLAAREEILFCLAVGAVLVGRMSEASLDEDLDVNGNVRAFGEGVEPMAVRANRRRGPAIAVDEAINGGMRSPGSFYCI